MKQLAPDLLGVFDPLEVESAASFKSKISKMIAGKWKRTPARQYTAVRICGRFKFADAVLRANGRLLMPRPYPLRGGE